LDSGLDNALPRHELFGMTVEKLRNLLNASPFRPFSVHVPSGHAVSVPARDFAAVSPSGRTLVVLGENESETVLDIMLIERVELQPLTSPP